MPGTLENSFFNIADHSISHSAPAKASSSRMSLTSSAAIRAIICSDPANAEVIELKIGLGPPEMFSPAVLANSPI